MYPTDTFILINPLKYLGGVVHFFKSPLHALDYGPTHTCMCTSGNFPKTIVVRRKTVLIHFSKLAFTIIYNSRNNTYVPVFYVCTCTCFIYMYVTRMYVVPLICNRSFYKGWLHCTFHSLISSDIPQYLHFNQRTSGHLRPD